MQEDTLSGVLWYFRGKRKEKQGERQVVIQIVVHGLSPIDSRIKLKYFELLR